MPIPILVIVHKYCKEIAKLGLKHGYLNKKTWMKRRYFVERPNDLPLLLTPSPYSTNNTGLLAHELLCEVGAPDTDDAFPAEERRDEDAHGASFSIENAALTSSPMTPFDVLPRMRAKGWQR